MKIQIKKALLEGHTPEVIVEAVHANQPHLDKSNPDNTSNRNSLGYRIKTARQGRDNSRSTTSQLQNNYANKEDNRARTLSQTGGGLDPKEYSNGDYSHRQLKHIVEIAPRLVTSAKE